MKNRFSQISKYFGDIVLLGSLIALFLVLVSANFKPGTFLWGWDNLTPEIDPSLTVSRLWQGVWQEFQGVGLLGGHGYMAALPHTLWVWFLTLFLPLEWVRYTTTFGTLITGVIGAYFLARYWLARMKLTRPGVWLGSWLAGLMYMFHLGTVLTFYVQLEPFIIFFAFLPWLLLTLFRLLEPKSTWKDWGLFFGLNVLASPIGFIPPVFVSYVLYVGIVLLGHWWGERKWMAVKKAIGVGLIMLATQAYWLLPLGYYTLTNSQVYLASKLNQLSTPEFILKNEAYGTLDEVSLLKGFFFESLDQQRTNSFGTYNSILYPWQNHLEIFQVRMLGYLIFMGALLGAGMFWLKSKKNGGRSMVVLWFTVFSILAMRVFPLSLVSQVLRFVPFLNQAFRSPFNKVSMSASLFLAFFFGVFGAFLIDYMVRHLKRSPGAKTWVSITTGAFLGLTVIFFSWPSFRGGFLYDGLKVRVPEAYFELFDFLKTQDKGVRIAPFPMHSANGWVMTKWGYTGSGFWWYGIEQPLLDRAFDVWSPYNESFYLMASKALYANRPQDLGMALQKYHVGLAVVDESVFLPGQDEKYLRFEETKKILTELGGEKVWQKDFLSVYRLPQEGGVGGGVFTPQAYEAVEAKTDYTKSDVVWQKDRSYILGTKPEEAYPFADLYQEHIGGVAAENEDEIRLERHLSDQEWTKAVIPGLAIQTPVRLSGRVRFDGQTVTVYFDHLATLLSKQQEYGLWQLPGLTASVPPKMTDILVTIGGKTLSVSRGEASDFDDIVLETNKPVELKIFDAGGGRRVSLDQVFLQTPVTKCWEREKTGGAMVVEKEGESYSIKTRDASGCLSMNLGMYDFSDSLVMITLPFKSLFGARPHFCLVAEGDVYHCEHDDVFYNSVPSENWSEVSRSVAVTGEKHFWLDVVARPPDLAGGSWEIAYKAPQVRVYPEVGGALYPLTIWKPVLEAQEIHLESGNQAISLRMVSAPVEADFAQLGRVEIDNCDLFSRGAVQKRVENGYVTYAATQKGAACDFVGLDRVSQHQQYLLYFKGSHRRGRSLKFYLFNRASRRNDLEVLLPEGNFEEAYGVVSWPSLQPTGYTLSLEARSYGPDVSSIELDQVSFFPLPMDSIARIRFETRDNLGRSGFGQFIDEKKPQDRWKTNELEVLKQAKMGIHHYTATVEGSGVLGVDQGFQAGWVGYGDGKRLEHVKVDGWANGYLVPEGVEQVEVVYWPQYLEWMGFGLLGLGLVVLVLRTRNKKASN